MLMRVIVVMSFHIGDWRKIDEIPYDFVRKRLSTVAEDPNRIRQLITKGVLQTMLEICSRVRLGEDSVPLDDEQEMIFEGFFAVSRPAQGRHRRRARHLRQHLEIYLHRHQRQFRQHAEHAARYLSVGFCTT